MMGPQVEALAMGSHTTCGLSRSAVHPARANPVLRPPSEFSQWSEHRTQWE